MNTTTTIKPIRVSAIYRVIKKLYVGSPKNAGVCLTLLSMLEENGNKVSEKLVKAIVDGWESHNLAMQLIDIEIVETEREEEKMILKVKGALSSTPKPVYVTIPQKACRGRDDE